MADYTLAVGTRDPHGFAAAGDGDAIRYAANFIESRLADDLARNPQEVVTLLGESGLLTRPSERMDEFVRRIPGPHTGLREDMVDTGDSNTPDCNGD